MVGSGSATVPDMKKLSLCSHRIVVFFFLTKLYWCVYREANTSWVFLFVNRPVVQLELMHMEEQLMHLDYDIEVSM